MCTFAIILAHGLVLSTQPAGGSLIANFEGDENATTLVCNISGDGVTQITTTWSIQNFRGSVGLTDLTASPEPFIVSGPPNPSAPQFSLLNELTVSNWTADLDGATIFCGTGQDQREASFFLRVYRKPIYILCLCVDIDRKFWGELGGDRIGLEKRMTSNALLLQVLPTFVMTLWYC